MTELFWLFQTYIGDILIAVNPYKTVPLYGDEVLRFFIVIIYIDINIANVFYIWLKKTLFVVSYR